MVDFADIVLGRIEQAISHNRDFAFEEGRAAFAKKILRMVSHSDSIPEAYDFTVDFDEDGDIHIEDEEARFDIYIMSSGISARVGFVPTNNIADESEKTLLAAGLLQKILSSRDVPPPSKWGMRITAPIPMKREAPDNTPCRMLESTVLSSLGSRIRELSVDDTAPEQLDGRVTTNRDGREQTFRFQAQNGHGSLQVTLDNQTDDVTAEDSYLDFVKAILDTLPETLGPLVEELADDEAVDHEFLKHGTR